MLNFTRREIAAELRKKTHSDFPVLPSAQTDHAIHALFFFNYEDC